MLKYYESRGRNIQAKKTGLYGFDSFSRNHTTPYSAIAVQELNLGYHYPKLFWNTACLAIDSGSVEMDGVDSVTKQTEYGKVARAIANISATGTEVSLPDINKASFGFIPNLDNNTILFGLKGIHGLGDEVVQAVISNRPYSSLTDFLEKNVYVGSIVKQGHTIQLIKGGAFDEVENKPREKILEWYLRSVSDPKKSLNMQNMGGIVSAGLVPMEFKEEYFIYEHRRRIFATKPYKVIPNNDPKLKKKIDDKYYLIKGKIADFFMKHYDDDTIIETRSDGSLVISSVEMGKQYDTLISPLRDHIVNSKSLLKKYNESLFQELWQKHASGSVSKWEMDSLSFYHGEHELTQVDENQYGVVPFESLESTPKIVGWNYHRGKRFPRHPINRIMGTVLDKNDMRNSITLLTPEGKVVTVKFYGGAFAHYNKQITEPREDGTGNRIVEKSWFTRGNKLLVAGFRRDDQFIPRKYADTIFRHTVALITDILDDGKLELQSDRYEVKTQNRK